MSIKEKIDEALELAAECGADEGDETEESQHAENPFLHMTDDDFETWLDTFAMALGVSGGDMPRLREIFPRAEEGGFVRHPSVTEVESVLAQLLEL